jgi:hypothetical protein
MKTIPIYTTRGDWVAMLVDDYWLYNPSGDWIGWVDDDRRAFSVRGVYAGWLGKDNRILRKRDSSDLVPRRTPPPTPPKLRFPSTVALAPLMGDLSYDTVDLFEYEPERLEPLGMEQLEDID